MALHRAISYKFVRSTVLKTNQFSTLVDSSLFCDYDKGKMRSDATFLSLY